MHPTPPRPDTDMTCLRTVAAACLLTACAPELYEDRDHPVRGDHGSGGGAGDTGHGAGDEGGDAGGGGDGGGSTAEDDARIVAAVFPEELGCDEATSAWVEVENTGTATWTREGGYKLGAVGDADPLKVGDVRVWLEEGDVVAPGEHHLFEIPLQGDGTEGAALTDWQMVHEGVRWFGEDVAAEVELVCEDGGSGGEEDLPLPDMWYVVQAHAAEYPDLLANSCQDTGGNWDWLDSLVDRLRTYDERWGYNWKRGVEGDPSRDVVDYHYGWGEREGSEEVYIIDVIVDHCGPDPQPGWTDQTQVTRDAGTIGRWTSRGRF